MHQSFARKHFNIILLCVSLMIASTFYYPSVASAIWPPDGWTYWLQNVSISKLVQEAPDVAVIDYSSTGGESGEWSSSEIQQLKDAEITVLAYFSIGEAEDYRFYWNSQWDTLAPEWLGPENPEWAGNYKVRYWMPEWKAILFGTADGSNKSYLDRILDQGFDGIYLDIIDAYYYWSEEAPTAEQYSDAADSMASLISQLNDYAASRGFENLLVFPQNGEWLQQDVSSSAFRSLYTQAISGIAVEDLFCPGDNDEDNAFDPRTDDKTQIDLIHDMGKTVLSVEYLTNPSIISTYLDAAETAGYIPLATVRALDEFNYNGPTISVGERQSAALPGTSHLRTYPNPFNGRLRVQLTGFQRGTMTLDLFAITGAWLRSQTVQVNGDGSAAVAIDADGLSSGVYLLRAGKSARRITLVR